jgi:sodium/bile acid cotransporter 7
MTPPVIGPFLGRRWFLLVLAAGVGLACARPGWVRPATDRLPLRAVVALSLFLVAWGLEGRRLYRMMLRPAAALWAVALSYGAVPLLAWLAGPLLPLPDLRLGLLVIASVPCTLASAVLWTRLGGGNEAVALLTVVLSTGLSWLATALWLTLATGTRVTPDTGAMMRGLALVLLLPVALAQLSRCWPPVARAVTRHQVLSGVAARLLTVAIILKAVVAVSGRTGGLTAGAFAATAAACVATHLAGLLLGLGSSRALGFARADAVAVAFGCSQKTLPVGLYLFEAYYSRDYPLAVVPLVVYHVGQLVVDTVIADWLAGRPSRPLAA